MVGYEFLGGDFVKKELPSGIITAIAIAVIVVVAGIFFFVYRRSDPAAQGPRPYVPAQHSTIGTEGPRGYAAPK